jgi:ELWxxDGT repeat protein
MVTGSVGSMPDDFFLFKGNLYFTASTGSVRKLYRISGTNGTVSLFKDINSGGDAFPGDANFFSNNNLLYFTADDGTNGTELWVSDGSATNTKMLKDITTGSAGTTFGEFVHFGNQVIFAVTTPAYSLDLWKTDGTNTTLIKSFNVPLSAFSAFGFLTFNNKLYFAGTDATHGAELWSTDGNTAIMVKDLYPGTESSQPILFNSVIINGHFLFTASDANGSQLWTSDGTAANTVVLKQINPSGGSDPILFPEINRDQILNEATGLSDVFDRTTLFNGYVFFSGNDGTPGDQLWKTNGTAAGTVMVKNTGGSSGGVADSYFYTKEGFYFSADDGTHGTEPWFTDGTTANTKLVKDINVGAGSSSPEFLFIYNKHLFASLNDGNSDDDYTDFYRIDATSTVLPVQLVSFKATRGDGAVKLDWTTATEINSSNFVIQRSIDGIHFSDIGTVNASGTSTVEKSYWYNDEQYLAAGADVLFYRLQLNDKDGKVSYSQVQTVRLNEANILQTYPNPVRNELTIVFGNSSSASALVTITDVNGKQVYLQKFSTANSHLQKIDVSRFSRGTYFVQLITDAEKKTVKFVKQ